MGSHSHSLLFFIITLIPALVVFSVVSFLIFYDVGTVYVLPKFLLTDNLILKL